MRAGSGGVSQGGYQGKGAPPLGSGRGLETMPEDDDTKVGYLLCLLAPLGMTILSC